MADKRFIAKWTGQCIKCGLAITPHVSEITWPRVPRKDGLKIQWHVSCSHLPDNQELIAARLAKKNGTIPAPVVPVSLPVPAPTIEQTFEVPAPVSVPEPIQPKQTEGKPVSRDFLAGMAEELVPHMIPHLDGKLTASMDAMSAELAQTVKDAVSQASQVVVIENRIKGEVKNIGGQHKLFAKLTELLMMGCHVYLHGGPGSGKSSAPAKIAEELGIPFAFIALSPATPESRLFGYMDASGTYVETEFYKRYTQGGMFLFEELDNGSASLLVTLNAALENKQCAFPNGMAKMHPDFICVGNGNTAGYGANPQFPERRPMDGAFKERFIFLEWGYDEQFERSLALSHNENAGKWVEWVHKLRAYCAKSDPKLLITPRASINGAKLLKAGFEPSEVAHMVIFKGFDKDSVSRIINANPVPVIPVSA